MSEAGHMVSFSFVLDRGPYVDYAFCRSFPGGKRGSVPELVNDPRNGLSQSHGLDVEQEVEIMFGI